MSLWYRGKEMYRISLSACSPVVESNKLTFFPPSLKVDGVESFDAWSVHADMFQTGHMLRVCGGRLDAARDITVTNGKLTLTSFDVTLT